MESKGGSSTGVRSHPCTPGKPPPMPPPVGATLSVYVSLQTRPMTFGSIVLLRIISSSVPFRGGGGGSDPKSEIETVARR